MVRGTGKYKQKRGGGRSFSKHVMLEDGSTGIADDRHAHRGRGGDDDEDEDDSEEGSEEEEDSDEGSDKGEGGAAGPELDRAERKKLKKMQAGKQKEEEEEDPDLINPNHVQKKLTISDLGAPRELSRREREQKEKQDAKDRYWKLHLQGKTDEAKSDLARLAKIRAEREAAQAKRKAETEAKAAEAESKRQAQLAKQNKK